VPSKKALLISVATFVVICGFFATASPALAADKEDKERVLHNFNGNDGIEPLAGLIFDAAGNLYGTTLYGGHSCGYGDTCGTVFRLTPDGNGEWKEKVLYKFNGGDGSHPLSSLIFDAAGNLYGTTWQGGAYGGGTVFRLAPGADGTCSEDVLYSFCYPYPSCPDGAYPYASLTFDTAGNLYSTTWLGGALGGGTVFQLAPGTGGKWTEKVLHSFGKGEDGANPAASLILDAAGNLYGTTASGGTYTSGCGGYGCGTVFELMPVANGKWTEKVLHNFNDNNGTGHTAGLIFDAAGNLYGTTDAGGAFVSGCGGYGCGTVFELTPAANGKWTEKLLHNFNDNSEDGSNPFAGLIFDGSGNLYGTTYMGGAYGGNGNGGSVFQLAPGTNGKWTEKVLRSFKSRDGEHPEAGLILDPAGNLYSTTFEGGTRCRAHGLGCGTVFEITP
jgi:uncharacterized repeat protein (TIGR03803 family)